MKYLISSLILTSYSVFYPIEIKCKLKELFFTPEIISLPIADWQNPSAEDYWKIQSLMKEQLQVNLNSAPSIRPFPTEYLNTEFYGWLLYRNGRLGLVKNTTEIPTRHVIHINNNPSNKKNCVICYAGCQSGGNDRDYEYGISIILKSLEKFNFNGYFIYYVGGWPNLKKDRLKWADVPFAFKPFLFEEARDLGYENILWLDACCVPVKSLDTIFEFIQEKGFVFIAINLK